MVQKSGDLKSKEEEELKFVLAKCFPSIPKFVSCSECVCCEKVKQWV